MKVAVVSRISALPPYMGSHRRILNLVRAMRSLGHSVHFVLLPPRKSARLDVTAHVGEFGSGNLSLVKRSLWLDLRYYPRVIANRIKRRLLKSTGVKSASYFRIDELRYPGFAEEVRALHEEHGFDAVIVECVYGSYVLDVLPPGVLKAIDTHDCFAERHRMFPTTEDAISYTPAEENKGLRRADVIIAIQQEEAEKFRIQLGQTPPWVTTVSHFPEFSDHVPDYSCAEAVFVGQSIIPNVQSLLHFMGRILPIVTAEVPSFRLNVVGKVCADIPDYPNVTKLGVVDDLQNVYARAPIAINPILSGTGINIKLLEAMAAGLAIVSTVTGCRGLDAAYTQGLLIVPDDNPVAFAQCLVTLLRDEKKRRESGRLALAGATLWTKRQMVALEECLSHRPGTLPSERTPARPDSLG